MTKSKKDTNKTAKKPARHYAEPTNSMGYLCRLNFRRFAKALENRTMQYGISSGQWRFLRVLWQEDGINQRELSRRVDMREPTTVVALKGMEKRGLIVRTRDADDKRKIVVHLTPEAKALQKKLMPFVADVNAIAKQGLTEKEIEVTQRVLARMAGNLAEEVESLKT